MLRVYALIFFSENFKIYTIYFGKSKHFEPVYSLSHLIVVLYSSQQRIADLLTQQEIHSGNDILKISTNKNQSEKTICLDVCLHISN